MEVSAALSAALASLTKTFDHDRDLETELEALTVELGSAIGSYLGLTMTITLHAHDIRFTVRQHATNDAQIAASLRIPLAALTATETASALILYAGRPGAFVDLAADLSYALDLDPAHLILDRHLTTPDDEHDGITGLAVLSRVNQAIGVLLERGHTPESARHELHRLAGLDHRTVHAAATELVHRAGRRPSDTADRDNEYRKNDTDP